MDREKILEQIRNLPKKSRFLVGFNEMAKDLSPFMQEDEVIEGVTTAYKKGPLHFIKNGRMMRSFMAVTNKNVYVISRGRMILSLVPFLKETIIIPRNEIVGIEENSLATGLKIMYDGDITIRTRNSVHNLYMGAGYKEQIPENLATATSRTVVNVDSSTSQSDTVDTATSQSDDVDTVINKVNTVDKTTENEISSSEKESDKSKISNNEVPLYNKNLEEEKTTGRFCSNCGALIPSTSKFCRGCGAPIIRENSKEIDTTNQATNTERMEEVYPAQNKVVEQSNISHVSSGENSNSNIIYTKPKKTKKIVIAVISIIAACIIGFIGLYIWEITEENKYIDFVKDGHPENYPNITYGESFEYFFEEENWSYFEDEANEDIVEFTGKCMVNAIKSTVQIQFVLDYENGYFSVGYIAVDKQPETDELVNEILEKIFQSYIDGDTERTLYTLEESEENSSDDTTYDNSEDNDDYYYDDNYDDSEDDDDEYDDTAEEYILPYSDTELLVEDDLDGLTAAECRIARNEIYARHGRRFNDEELQDYFDNCSWYSGTIEPEDFSESLLKETELKNLRLIQNYESEMGY